MDEEPIQPELNSMLLQTDYIVCIVQPLRELEYVGPHFLWGNRAAGLETKIGQIVRTCEGEVAIVLVAFYPKKMEGIGGALCIRTNRRKTGRLLKQGLNSRSCFKPLGVIAMFQNIRNEPEQDNRGIERKGDKTA